MDIDNTQKIMIILRNEKAKLFVIHLEMYVPESLTATRTISCDREREREKEIKTREYVYFIDCC